jgi:hypothetical protein
MSEPKLRRGVPGWLVVLVLAVVVALVGIVILLGPRR